MVLLKTIVQGTQMLNKNILATTAHSINFSSIFKFVNILLFCLFSSILYAQYLKEFETGFSTIFMDPLTVDSYHFGNNPAYLNFSVEDEFLSLKSQFHNDEGNFKKFITPGIIRSTDYFGSGKKSLDSTQRFKGSFGFSKIERRNWDWFFTRDYETDNPFLIGDSTSGKTRINGIILNAQYGINFFDNLAAGISLDYSVDEGLKTVSPRPTSDHRDIHGRLGLGYSLTKNFSLGVIVDVTDKNEQISYREDEGALNQETVILKFKGYDFPNVLRKKVETRYAYTSGYAAGITFSYNNSSRYYLAGYLNSGFDKNSIKDDALDPKGVGFWKDDYLEAGIKVAVRILEDINTGFSYNYAKRDGWAKYPAADALYYERNSHLHSFIFGTEKKMSDAIRAGLEIGVSLSSQKENDHYSMVKSSNRFNQYFSKLGINYTWSNNLSTLVSYSYAKKGSLASGLNFPSLIVFGTAGNAGSSNNSGYYTKYRVYDLLYLQTEFVKQSFSITSELRALVPGTILFYIDYSFVKPQFSSYYGDADRKEFNLILEFRVKVI